MKKGTLLFLFSYYRNEKHFGVISLNNNILIIGGDCRFDYVKEFLNERGFSVTRYTSGGDIQKKNIKNFDICVLPVPFSKDDIHIYSAYSLWMPTIEQIKQTVSDKICFTSSEKIKGFNYMADDELLIYNGKLTALGVLKELLMVENENIENKNALVLGFGNVAKPLCSILKNLGLNIKVALRNIKQKETAEALSFSTIDIYNMYEKISDFDFIFNTVPAFYFTKELISETKMSAKFFEIASGLDKETISMTRSYTDCKGMPGKHFPKSAGLAIARYISDKLKVIE